MSTLFTSAPNVLHFVLMVVTEKKRNMPGTGLLATRLRFGAEGD
jgi:hypothetical protein